MFPRLLFLATPTLPSTKAAAYNQSLVFYASLQFAFSHPTLLVATPTMPELPVYPPLMVATPTLPELPLYPPPLLVATPTLPELPVYIGFL